MLDADEWVALQGDVRAKRRALAMQPCGVPGILKTSRLGTQFFAHKPGHSDCGTQHPGETPLHLTAKAEILLGCADAGWDAAPEVRADDGPWIADVLATKGEHKLAFEVQVSQQTRDRYAERQVRYQRDGIRCAWYVKHQGSVLPPTAELPTFLLEQDEDKALFAAIGGYRLPLREAARVRLTCELRFRQHVSNGQYGEVEVQVAPSNGCYRCGRSFLLWRVTEERVTGKCGRVGSNGIRYDSPMWNDTKPEADDLVRAAVRDATTNHPLRLANLSMKYTKTTQTRYMVFSCPHCGGVYGDWFLSSFWMKVYDSDIITLTVPGGPPGIEDPHWCLDQGNGTCVPLVG